jgi:hypothetical protein
MRQRVIGVVFGMALLAACGGDDTASTAADPADPGTSSTTEVGAEAEERVASMWTSLVVEPSGERGRVTEVIEYDFSTNERHGIYREIDDLDPNADITVSSPTAPDEVEITETEFGVRIQIGDPDETITGVHSYTISYPLRLDDRRPIVWDAVGTAWSVPIDAAEVHLTGSTAWVDTDCRSGPDDDVESCDSLEQPEPGHLVAGQSGVEPGVGMTIGAARGEPLSAAPDPPEAPSPG